MRSRIRFSPPPAFVVASCVLAGVGAAAAQDPPRAPDGPRPGGGPMRPGGPGFGPGMFLAPPLFDLADADKDGKLTPDEAGRAAAQLVRDADAGKAGGVDAAALGRALNRKLGPPPGFGPDGPPGEFGPGTMLAPRVVEAADADKDGKLSPDEAERAAAGFVREIDAKGAGAIEPDALAGAINRRMGPPPGFGPGGPMGGEERKVVKDHDKDGDGRLDRAERAAARAALKADRAKAGGNRGGFPFGPPPGGGPMGGRGEEPVSPGPHVEPADAKTFPGKNLYDPDTFRTLFLEFEEPDWEATLEEFHGTDVELPATLTVDGRKYRGVGVHFRGMSSYGMVRAGHKRSFNVSVDLVDPKQTIDGYKTLNLLNAHEDPSLLHAVLYLQVARNFIPAPKANFVKVVVNGESWGVYTNAQQFDRKLLAENFSTPKGARWKVRGNPGADGGLTYVGDKVEDYKRRYEIKSGDNERDWKALIALCKALNETPPDKLEAALKPILDVEGVLRFLALDVALINGDGYWTRASDYSLYRDPAGVFHVLPHDANETFGPAMMFGPRPGGGPGGPGGFGRGPGRPGGGPGGPGGPGAGPGMGPRPMNVDLDPLVGLDDARTPLRSKLLAVPALRRRYLEHVRAIATDWLDWGKLGPVVARYRALIGPEVAADTRKLNSTAAFEAATADAPAPPEPGGRPSMSLRQFADARRRYLLDYPEIKKLGP